MKKEILVVGCGFSGTVIAREIAEKTDYSVKVIEIRDHIAGNMYDDKDEHEVLVQRYGPHTINTNEYYVVEYLKKYIEMFRFDVKLMSYIDGKHVRLPFNFLTMRQLVGESKAEILLKKMRAEFKGKDRVSVFRILDSDDEDISAYGNLLFEKAYRTYTSKMWGLDPKDIDKSVLNRVQMAMGYDERYLNKDFQYMPKGGFTKLFESMLNHAKIEITLSTDAVGNIAFDDNSGKVLYDGVEYERVIFTGALDDLFQNKYGELPYVSLDFVYENFDSPDVLPCDIVSYPQAIGYTRKTEYIKITGQDKNEVNSSTVVTEYPMPFKKNGEKGNVRFYPVINKENMAQHEKYKAEAGKYSNLMICGRLAEYKYINMDITIMNALNFSGKLIDELKR